MSEKLTEDDLQNDALKRVIGMASMYLSSCTDRYGHAAAAINTVMDLLERRRAPAAPAPQMDICPKCQGTGTAGHSDSGHYCDCDGGMVPATPARDDLRAALETIRAQYVLHVGPYDDIANATLRVVDAALRDAGGTDGN